MFPLSLNGKRRRRLSARFWEKRGDRRAILFTLLTTVFGCALCFCAYRFVGLKDAMEFLLPFQNLLIPFCFLYPSEMAQEIMFCNISFTCFQCKGSNCSFFENNCIIFFINPIAICHGRIKLLVYSVALHIKHIQALNTQTFFWQLRSVHMTRRSWLISVKIPNNGALWQRSGCYLQVPLDLCRS